MTTKRDKKKDEAKAERPKLKKEKLRDLAPDREAEGIRGGARLGPACTDRGTGCVYD